jgi:hypothetical protein
VYRAFIWTVNIHSIRLQRCILLNGFLQLSDLIKCTLRGWLVNFDGHANESFSNFTIRVSGNGTEEDINSSGLFKNSEGVTVFTNSSTQFMTEPLDNVEDYFIV